MARSVAMLLLALATYAAAAEDERPTLAVTRITSDVRVDGALDEPEWATAAAIENLVMVEPRQGESPSGRTEVRVLAQTDALAFGIRCLTPPGSTVVSFTKERDADQSAEDHVTLVLDPSLDGRSGYMFSVNPGGARLDGLINPGGESADTSWDGEWEAATRRDATGWTAEVRIPATTLRYRRGISAWGFNVERRVQSLQETDRWASPQRDFPVFLTSRAGLLTNLPSFDLGLGLGVRPSLVASAQQGPAGAGTDGSLDPSLDVTQRLGTSALASLSIKTDFAETEVDTLQTNLTRFPLFFPEKRTFFLDGADIFSFGVGLGGDSLVPFFSRRIGLVGDREVPIDAGLKTIGSLGHTSFGALAVHTGEVSGLAPASTMGVVRLRQDIWTESRVGVLVAGGDPLGRPGSWEAGVDFTYQTSHFRGNRSFIAGGWLLATGRGDLADARERTAFGFKLNYPNDLWNCALTYRRIGDGFDPSLGFVPRRGINMIHGSFTFAPRPQGTFIRQMEHELKPSLITDLDGHWESYEVFTAPINWRLESGDRFELNVAPAGERLREPFAVTDGVAIPPGSYHWTRYRLELRGAAKRRLSGRATWWFGGFYTGRLHQISGEAAWTPTPLVTLLLNAERDIGELREGRFDLSLLGAKVRLNLSPDLQLNCFVQYDKEARSIGTNARLRWTFNPRGDLFVVYNHNLLETADRWRRDSSALLVKAQYTFQR